MGRYPGDLKGLGMGITWAWDPTLCAKLKPVFVTSAFGVSIGIDCNSFKSAMHRAFATWSQVSMPPSLHSGAHCYGHIVTRPRARE